MGQIWVSPDDGDRKVKNPENSKASGIFNTKTEAEQAARQIAINQRLELIVQKKDWTIQYKDSFGNDLFPPRW